MILVVGAGGFLGRRVVSALQDAGFDCLRASHAANADVHLDLSQSVGQLILPKGVSHAVILSSITSIDECFLHPKSTGQFNVTHTIQLIEQLLAQAVTPVFISSDAVFDGAQGDYREEDIPAPVTKYGEQKRAVEIFLERNASDHLIVRLGKLFTLADDDNSPVSGLVRSLGRGESVRAATDQFLSPTLAEEAAVGIVKLIELKARGVFHVAPKGGSLTRYAMALAVAEAIGADAALVSSCSIADFSFAEPRPVNSTLNGERFCTATGIRLTPFLEVAKQLG